MEAEKIKTIEEFLIEYMDQKPKVYNDGITERCYPVSAVIQMMKDHAAQFKQPPVSVMPSEELYQALKNCVIELEQIRDGIAFTPSEGRISRAAEAIKKYELSLSKEAPKERIPDVGETIKETAIDLSIIRDIIRKNSGYEYVTGHGILANDVHIHGLTEDIFDLFKQRNK